MHLISIGIGFISSSIIIPRYLHHKFPVLGVLNSNESLKMVCYTTWFIYIFLIIPTVSSRLLRKS